MKRFGPWALVIGLGFMLAGLVISVDNPEVTGPLGMGDDTYQCSAPYDIVLNDADQRLPGGRFGEETERTAADCRSEGKARFGTAVGFASVGLLGVALGATAVIVSRRRRRG